MFWRAGGSRDSLRLILDRSISTRPILPPLIHKGVQSQWPNYRGQSDFLPTSSVRHLSTESSVYPVIHAAEVSFETIHSLSHLPWWAVVISTTVVLRSVLTLPLAIHQNRTIAKMELLLPTLKEYQEAVKHNVVVKCRRANLPVEEANRQLRKAVKTQNMCENSFVILSRLRGWLRTSMPRRGAVPIVWQCCPGSNCHCGSPSPSL